jgi:hypothetical protein
MDVRYRVCRVSKEGVRGEGLRSRVRGLASRMQDLGFSV